ncbi:hypothetical protein EO087_05665 [Dyella sp. M7H15-1]|uniref:hypothetical protein n=1 Tax=Dyella sp. M7H15-1 TaxID=2501295 RepID=UPI001004F2A7|nr:hypothetical protein [Dyella sp. M7H15-1]QAU23536.1 hypothetical protein EO087_05665 [Dyella sp. M7H15-1]
MKRLSSFTCSAVLGVTCTCAAVFGAFNVYAQNYPRPAWPDLNPNPRYFNPCFDNSAGNIGNEALTIVVITPTQYEGTQPDGSPGFDALWASHAQFWEATHGGAGLTYSLEKGQQLSNPLDPTSAPTGNDMYVLHECYPAGYAVPEKPPLTAQNDDILEHWAYTAANWSGFNQIIALMEKPGVTVVTLHHGQVVHANWHLYDGISPPLLPPWEY